jgi:hypothetical protein
MLMTKEYGKCLIDIKFFTIQLNLKLSSEIIVKRYISDLVPMIHLWNNLHQVHLKSKYLKTKCGSRKTIGHKHDSQNWAKLTNARGRQTL